MFSLTKLRNVGNLPPDAHQSSSSFFMFWIVNSRHQMRMDLVALTFFEFLWCESSSSDRCFSSFKIRIIGSCCSMTKLSPQTTMDLVALTLFELILSCTTIDRIVDHRISIFEWVDLIRVLQKALEGWWTSSSIHRHFLSYYHAHHPFFIMNRKQLCLVALIIDQMNQDNPDGSFHSKLTLFSRRLRQGKIRRGALLNPNESAFEFLFNSGQDDALVTLCGFDHQSFATLHNRFKPLFDNNSPYKNDGRLIGRHDKKKGGASFDQLNARSCFGSSLD